MSNWPEARDVHERVGKHVGGGGREFDGWISSENAIVFWAGSGLAICLYVALCRHETGLWPVVPLIYITNMFQFGRLGPNADIKMLQSQSLLIVIGCLA